MNPVVDCVFNSILPVVIGTCVGLLLFLLRLLLHLDRQIPYSLCFLPALLLLLRGSYFLLGVLVVAIAKARIRRTKTRRGSGREKSSSASNGGGGGGGSSSSNKGSGTISREEIARAMRWGVECSRTRILAALVRARTPAIARCVLLLDPALVSVALLRDPWTSAFLFLCSLLMLLHWTAVAVALDLSFTPSVSVLLPSYYIAALNTIAAAIETALVVVATLISFGTSLAYEVRWRNNQAGAVWGGMLPLQRQKSVLNLVLWFVFPFLLISCLYFLSSLTLSWKLFLCQAPAGAGSGVSADSEAFKIMSALNEGMCFSWTLSFVPFFILCVLAVAYSWLMFLLDPFSKSSPLHETHRQSMLQVMKDSLWPKFLHSIVLEMTFLVRAVIYLFFLFLICPIPSFYKIELNLSRLWKKRYYGSAGYAPLL